MGYRPANLVLNEESLQVGTVSEAALQTATKLCPSGPLLPDSGPPAAFDSLPSIGLKVGDRATFHRLGRFLCALELLLRAIAWDLPSVQESWPGDMSPLRALNSLQAFPYPKPVLLVVLFFDELWINPLTDFRVSGTLPPVRPPRATPVHSGPVRTTTPALRSHFAQRCTLKTHALIVLTLPSLLAAIDKGSYTDADGNTVQVSGDKLTRRAYKLEEQDGLPTVMVKITDDPSAIVQSDGWTEDMRVVNLAPGFNVRTRQGGYVAPEILDGMNQVDQKLAAKTGSDHFLHAYADDSITQITEAVTGDGTTMNLTGIVQSVSYNDGITVNAIIGGRAATMAFDDFKQLAFDGKLDDSLDDGIQVSSKAKLARTAPGFIAVVDDGKLTTYRSNTYEQVGESIELPDDWAFASVGINQDGQNMGKLAFIKKPSFLDDGSAAFESETEFDWASLAGDKANPAFQRQAATA